ncbi:MAG: hypothetical protein AAB438_02870 [Patescibacteria group bacterium]
MKESRTYLQNIKNTQEYPPKTVLEQELAMELQTLLDDKNFKGPKLDITLYFGIHATENSAKELATYCKEQNIDVLADEYVYTGDILDPDLLEKKKSLAEESSIYGETLKKELNIPTFSHDLTPGDFLRKDLIRGLIETSPLEDEMYQDIRENDFNEFCEKTTDKYEKFRNMQRTREGVVLQTFAEKTAKNIISNKVQDKEELKTLVFFGIDHYQFYRNFSHIHPNFKIHFQDTYLNEFIKNNPGKTPPFALGMAAYNSIKNEEEQFIEHTESEKDPYRYIAQELRLRLNNEEFHNWKQSLFDKSQPGKVYEHIAKDIDKMAQKYSEKESSYYKVAKELFDEFKEALNG